MSAEPSIRALIDSYTQDPIIRDMWTAVRKAGSLRSISMDITRHCNLRCVGCYFFAENMDAAGEADEHDFDAFVNSEAERGTNFVTVLGGEPSLAIGRLQRLAQRFKLMIVTNGLRTIPVDGLEDTAIAISVWGDRETDKRLRGNDRIEVFERAVENYHADTRVVWYITLPPRPSDKTEEIVDICVRHNHLVGFNYYGDLQNIGGDFDHAQGFLGAQQFVDRMIDRYASNIVFTKYLNRVVTTGQMQGQQWGYPVCASISADNSKNKDRIENGNPYSPHFRAYNPDLKSTRRCCVGEDRDCRSCYDVWAHVSWISLSLERHLDCVQDFASWLSTVYMFYGVVRLVEPAMFRRSLPQIQSLLSGTDYMSKPRSRLLTAV